MTKNHSELLSKISTINVDPYVDSYEMALRALSDALPHAAPNSLAYVFTDAPPSSFTLLDNVLQLVRKKQVKVSFLLTGGSTSPRYDAYRKIAQVSDGQIFEMERGNVKDVLLKTTETLDTKFTALESKNFDKAGKSETKLNVDESINKLTVSVSGKNSQLIVKNQKNDMVGGTAFSLNNIKFLSFNKKDSLYTIEASADSAYSVRAGGISDLKFEFGFSVAAPVMQAETSIQPLVGTNNVLSIFISDPKLVKCLIRATIIPAGAPDDFTQFDIPLKKVRNNFFSSHSVRIPTQMFKIIIFGYDSKGNEIERIISSAIQSITSSKSNVICQKVALISWSGSIKRCVTG